MVEETVKFAIGDFSRNFRIKFKLILKMNNVYITDMKKQQI